jgi:hypothetical protein
LPILTLEAQAMGLASAFMPMLVSRRGNAENSEGTAIELPQGHCRLRVNACP